MRPAWALAAALAALGCGGVPAGAPPAEPRPAAWGFEGGRFAVAADHPLASAAGAGLLEAGGNVVDAAAATAFALAVTRPYSAGLGGGGFMLIHLRGRGTFALDYRETAPAAARPERYLDPDGRVIPGKTVHGHWAVGVPGQVAGLALALRRYGTRSLAEVLQPAIRLAEEGFPVDADTRDAMAYLAERARMGGPGAEAFAEAARVFLKGGEAYAVGDILKQPDLARSLRLLAREGPRALYQGELGRAIVADMERHGGPLSAADLEGYRVKERRPLLGSFRGRRIVGMPPPSSGGACLLQMLVALEGAGAGSLAPGPLHHALAESMKHAFADRAAFLGDPDAHPGVAADVAEMISPARARRVGAALLPERTREPERYGRRGLKDDSGTTHFSVLDAEGNAVAATETINLWFGSLVVPPGTGIALNDELDDFALKTDVPNEFGLLMSERALLRPGARPLSSMSPTLVLDKDRAVLAAGGSGGPRIISATLQVVFRVLALGERPDAAVAAPRIHHQWSPDVLRVEAGVPEAVRWHLEERGHVLEPYAGHPGIVQVALRRRGRLYAASDPRKGGRPAGL